MAYSKHTWNTNDVITTALMNALETGAEEAYLWSEAVIDSDKDMSGNELQNARITGQTNLFTIITPSDNVKASDDTVGGTTTTHTKYREFQMGANLYAAAVKPATIRVSFDIRVTGGGTSITAGIGTNGGAGPVSGSTSSIEFQTFVGDIEVNGGDLVQFSAGHSGDAGGEFRNVRISYDVEEIVLTPELVITQTL